MLSVCTIIIAGLAAFSASLPAEFEDLVLHEQREDQTSWIKRDALDDDSLLPMQIGLTQNNLDKEYEFLMEVYVSLNGVLEPFQFGSQCILTRTQFSSELQKIRPTLHLRGSHRSFRPF